MEQTTIDFEKETQFWEKKFVEGDLDGNQANVGNKTRNAPE